MSYCFNPTCVHPENLTHTSFCQACNSQLLLRERYRALEPLGRGGFGATFLSRNEANPQGNLCVVKQLRPAATSRNQLKMARELFEREARTLKQVGSHPQVPELLESFVENEEFYLVQEYIEGETLRQEVERRGPFDESEVRTFLLEILPVLAFIHQQRVIHRDLKPANLIRRKRDSKLVLIDFGAVKHQVGQTVLMSGEATGTENSESDRTALTAFAVGTPGFAPPEQMALRPVYASDVYALGMTCLYLLTGRSPKHLEHDPSTGELLWQSQVSLSPDFSAILKKMLEDAVRQRYRAATDVLRDLNLAPHLGALAQSLTAQKPSKPVTTQGYRSAFRKPSTTSGGNSTSQSLGHSSGSGQTSGNSQSSAGVVRLATAIRRRKSEQAGTALRSAPPRPIVVTPLSPSANDLEQQMRLLRTDYTKGIRNFSGRELSQVNLRACVLCDAIFSQARLTKTNLRGADLRHTNFSQASLAQADLRDAHCTDAYFSHTDLAGADLRGADLRNAYLSNANLRGANLGGANLTGAKVTPEQLALARTNWNTIFPNGKKFHWRP